MNTNHDCIESTANHRKLTWQLCTGVILGAALLSGCQGGQVLDITDQGSHYNQAMAQLAWWAIILSVIIFIAVSAALFYTVQKFREDKNPSPPMQFDGNHKLEAVLVFVPVVLVIFLSVLSVRYMALLNPVSKDSLPINALAKQFWWNFSYPSAKAADGALVSNGNELIMPTVQKVAIDTTSGDVIHGFWAPNLGGQRASIPGVHKVWEISTSKDGVYQGNCSQLCGSSHANMRYKIVALPKERFDAFLKTATDYKAPTPAAGSAEERGMNVFMKGTATAPMSCSSCHRIQGTDAKGTTGPDLSFFGTRRTLGAGVWEAMSEKHWEDPEASKALHEWIKHSPVVKPGSLMPRYDGGEYLSGGKKVKGGTLTDTEIDDVAAYLRSLKLPEEADYWKGVHISGTDKTAGGTQ